MNKENGTDNATIVPQDIATNMAQAFQDLARGEQTATAMENKLSSLEERIDSLLNYFEGQEANSNEVAGDSSKIQSKDKSK